MEFRNIFSEVFGLAPKVENLNNIQLVNSYKSYITSYNAEIFNDLTVRTCVDTIARHVSKLKPSHLLTDSTGRHKQNTNINTLLTNRPNSYMSTADFLYKITSQLLYYGNSFVYIQKNSSGKITGFYPIEYGSAELKEFQSQLFLKFNFQNGKNIAIPYTDIIHLRRNFSSHELLGQEAHQPLLDTLTNLAKARQSISNKVENGGKISGVLKLAGNIGQQGWLENAKRFVKSFMSSTSDTGGLAAIDSSAEFIPINIKPESAEDSQLKFLQQEVYSYFGITEAIINGSYDETQWQAFYESTIETIKIQLSQEFTEKTFTQKEKEYGNIIDFNSNRLSYASTNNKVKMVKELGALGLLTTNEARELFDLAPLEDGDKRLISLNYVNADIADEYQLNKNEDATNGN